MNNELYFNIFADLITRVKYFGRIIASSGQYLMAARIKIVRISLEFTEFYSIEKNRNNEYKKHKSNNI
jgi:hypothetical protein